MAVAVVTTPTLLSTAPVPLVKTGVRVVLLPAVMVAAPAVRLVATGAGTTVTVQVATAVLPAALVTVRV